MSLDLSFAVRKTKRGVRHLIRYSMGLILRWGAMKPQYEAHAVYHTGFLAILQRRNTGRWLWPTRLNFWLSTHEREARLVRIAESPPFDPHESPFGDFTDAHMESGSCHERSGNHHKEPYCHASEFGYSSAITMKLSES
jgi:hypothetical protein